jgi:hypothetical protein
MAIHCRAVKNSLRGTFIILFVLCGSGTYTVPICGSNGNNIETKAEQNLDFVFDIEAKRTCLFENL